MMAEFKVIVRPRGTFHVHWAQPRLVSSDSSEPRKAFFIFAKSYRALPTKTAPHYLDVHPLPIATNPGPFPKHTRLSAIRSTRDRLCTFCCMRAEYTATAI